MCCCLHYTLCVNCNTINNVRSTNKREHKFVICTVVISSSACLSIFLALICFHSNVFFFFLFFRPIRHVVVVFVIVVVQLDAVGFFSRYKRSCASKSSGPHIRFGQNGKNGVPMFGRIGFAERQK